MPIHAHAHASAYCKHLCAMFPSSTGLAQLTRIVHLYTCETFTTRATRRSRLPVSASASAKHDPHDHPRPFTTRLVVLGRAIVHVIVHSILYRGADCTPSYPSYSTIPPFPILHDPSDPSRIILYISLITPSRPTSHRASGQTFHIVSFNVLTTSLCLSFLFRRTNSNLFFVFALCILHPSFIVFLFFEVSSITYSFRRLYTFQSTPLMFVVHAMVMVHGSWLRIWS